MGEDTVLVAELAEDVDEEHEGGGDEADGGVDRGAGPGFCLDAFLEIGVEVASAFVYGNGVLGTRPALAVAGAGVGVAGASVARGILLVSALNTWNTRWFPGQR